MTMALNGLAKLAEELGELQQVVGKMMAYGTGAHPDGTESLVIEGDTIEELKLTAAQETEKRGWTDCWSEKCDD